MTPLNELIQSIQHSRQVLETVKSIIKDGKHMPLQYTSILNLIELDEKLNEIGSILAALNITKDLPDREEYFERLSSRCADYFEDDGSNDSKLKTEILFITFDTIKEREARIGELEEALTDLMSSYDKFGHLLNFNVGKVKSLLNNK